MRSGPQIDNKLNFSDIFTKKTKYLNIFHWFFTNQRIQMKISICCELSHKQPISLKKPIVNSYIYSNT